MQFGRRRAERSIAAAQSAVKQAVQSEPGNSESLSNAEFVNKMGHGVIVQKHTGSPQHRASLLPPEARSWTA